MALSFTFIPLYFGRTFVAGPTQGSFNSIDMDDALTRLCASSYFDPLEPFGAGAMSIHNPGEVAPMDWPATWSVDPKQGFTNDDIANFIRGELDAGRAPRPASFVNTPAYLVFIRHGAFSRDHDGAVGYHYSFRYHDQDLTCAWIMQGDDIDGTTPIASHEMVEIVSSALGFGERGDPCGPANARINGVLAAAYVSATHTCIVPNAYSKPLGSVVWMAWKGVGEDPGIYYTWLNGSWQQQLNVPRVGTSDSPALTPHEDTLWMAWKGEGADQAIYWSTLNDSGWEAQHAVPGVATSSHPALASLGGVLYLAWKGAAGDDGIWWTSWLGDRWDAQRHIPGRATSTGVNLFSSGTQLHMAWKGQGDDVGIFTATFDARTHSWSAQANVPGVGTSDTPVMAGEPTFVGEPDRILLAWKGVPGDERVFQSMGSSGAWSAQTEQPAIHTTSHPALIGNGAGSMWQAWRDADGRIMWSEGDEGFTWSTAQTVAGVGSSHAPALSLFAGGPRRDPRMRRPRKPPEDKRLQPLRHP